ncbi:MAG TPA: methyltransferase domain-containing protein [Longimicrobiaceae bacterium]
MTGLPRLAGAAERMDEPEVDRAELARSLHDLRGVNRWLGGRRVVLRHLEGMVRRLGGRAFTVLDVGTGSGDLPLAVARWARARGIGARITATDLHPRTLALAREHTARDPDVRVEPADALDLPYGPGAFDFALCSTALHHFEDPEAVRVLRELDRVARWGVVVNDLRRSRPALLGASLLAATVWRTHPVTRHDGPVSVRRAFTPAELRELGRRAGMRGARVYAHLPFRVALVADRTGGGG